MAASSTDGRLVLAICVDDAFLPLAWVVARSVARHIFLARPSTLHVFHAGIDKALARRLERLRCWRMQVRVHHLHDELKHLASDGEAVPPVTYAKLLLPRLLPDEPRVLYLDADTLALRDVTPLFETNLQGLPLGGVPDIPQCRPPRVIEHHRFTGTLQAYYRDVLGLALDLERFSYINAGVMVMDLEALRAERFTERALELANRIVHRTLWQDQDVINVVLHGRIALLDPQWNVIPSVFDGPCDVTGSVRDLLLRQRDVQAIVHFAGHNKPWLRPDVRYGGAWLRLARRSPFFVRRRETWLWKLKLSTIEWLKRHAPGTLATLLVAWQRIRARFRRQP